MHHNPKNNDLKNPGVRPPLSEEQVKAILQRADRNGDDILNKEELKNAFKDLGCRIPGYRASRAIAYADINGDGCISGDSEMHKITSYALKYFGGKKE